MRTEVRATTATLKFSRSQAPAWKRACTRSSCFFFHLDFVFLVQSKGRTSVPASHYNVVRLSAHDEVRRGRLTYLYCNPVSKLELGNERSIMLNESSIMLSYSERHSAAEPQPKCLKCKMPKVTKVNGLLCSNRCENSKFLNFGSL